MVRTIWKGAISFGLVHIPVALSAAVSSERIDFDWLDQRTMDPVGYKRIKKTTGKNVDKEDIVQAVLYENGRYVVISEDEIRKARSESTQTIDIFSFVSQRKPPPPRNHLQPRSLPRHPNVLPRKQPEEALLGNPQESHIERSVIDQ